MNFIRIKHCDFEQKFNAFTSLDTLDNAEWKDTGRLDESSWTSRYEYEASLISEIIKEKNHKKILEIGGGPGILSQFIQRNFPNETLEYDLIDKPYAKEYFEKNNFKGRFFDKDISIDLDVAGLKSEYDLIICNDVLEHLIAPSNVVKKIHNLLTFGWDAVISVPNWRMAHQFLYRGLWDYDNF